jgi:hypothetical protein
VIWPEKYDPKTSAIYALNDIDVKPMKIRIIIVATCAALVFSMTGPVSVRDGEAITKAFEAAVPNIPWQVADSRRSQFRARRIHRIQDHY